MEMELGESQLEKYCQSHQMSRKAIQVLYHRFLDIQSGGKLNVQALKTTHPELYDRPVCRELLQGRFGLDKNKLNFDMFVDTVALFSDHQDKNKNRKVPDLDKRLDFIFKFLVDDGAATNAEKKKGVLTADVLARSIKLFHPTADATDLVELAKESLEEGGASTGMTADQFKAYVKSHVSGADKEFRVDLEGVLSDHHEHDITK